MIFFINFVLRFLYFTTIYSYRKLDIAAKRYFIKFINYSKVYDVSSAVIFQTRLLIASRQSLSNPSIYIYVYIFIDSLVTVLEPYQKRFR